MTPAQKLAFRNFIVTSDAPWTSGGTTQTLAERWAAGEDGPLAQALNNPELGILLGKKVGNPSIDAITLKATLAGGADFNQINLNNLQFWIQSDPFPLNLPGAVSGLDGFLSNYPLTRAQFHSVLQTDASIAEWLADEAGFHVTVDDITALRQLP